MSRFSYSASGKCQECNSAYFQSVYYRNNKSGGQKNLRCFPHCCGHHSPNGFCGAGVVVETTLNCTDLFVFARFEQVSAQPDVSLGSIVQLHMMEQQSKSAANMLGQWMKGYPLGRGIYKINGQRQSWHYGWTSNRAINSSTFHLLKVYMFKLHARQFLECVEVIASEMFQIKCSRKNMQKPKLPTKRTRVEEMVSRTNKAKSVGLLIYLLLNSDTSWIFIDFNYQYSFGDLSPSRVQSSNEIALGNVDILSDTTVTNDSKFQVDFHGNEEKTENYLIIVAKSLAKLVSEKKFHSRLVTFMAENPYAASKAHLLDEAYSEFVELFYSEINIFLEKFNTNINELSQLMLNCKYFKTDTVPSFLQQVASDDFEGEQFGFYAFVSQMRQVMTGFSKSLQEVKPPPVIHGQLKTTELKCADLLQINGTWSKNAVKSDILVFPEGTLAMKQLVAYFFNYIMKGSQIKFSGSALEIQNNYTLMPNCWAHFTLDSHPHFNPITAFGISSCFTGNRLGDYRGWVNESEGYIYLEQYFWTPSARVMATRMRRRFYILNENEIKIVLSLDKSARDDYKIDSYEICSQSVEDRVSKHVDWVHDITKEFYLDRVHKC